jgi:hypothetical protein
MTYTDREMAGTAAVDLISAHESATGKSIAIPVFSARADFIAAIRNDPSMPAIWRPDSAEVEKTDRLIRDIWNSNAHIRTEDGDITARFIVSSNRISTIGDISGHYSDLKPELEDMARLRSEIAPINMIKVTCMVPFRDNIAHTHTWGVINRTWLHEQGTTLLDDGRTQKGDYVYIPPDMDHHGPEVGDAPRLIVAAY